MDPAEHWTLQGPHQLVQMSVTSGTGGVQVKLNAPMEFVSLRDIILPCQNVEAVLDHVSQTAYWDCRHFVWKLVMPGYGLVPSKYLVVKTWKDSVSSRWKETRSATPKDWPTSINADAHKKANVWYLVSQRQAKPIIIMASERLVFLRVDYRTQGLINFWLVSNSGGRVGILLNEAEADSPITNCLFKISLCGQTRSSKHPSDCNSYQIHSGVLELAKPPPTLLDGQATAPFPWKLMISFVRQDVAVMLSTLSQLNSTHLRLWGEGREEIRGMLFFLSASPPQLLL